MASAEDNKPRPERPVRYIHLKNQAMAQGLQDPVGSAIKKGQPKLANPCIFWRPQRDLNPCCRRERPVSWARLDDGDPLNFGMRNVECGI